MVHSIQHTQLRPPLRALHTDEPIIRSLDREDDRVRPLERVEVRRLKLGPPAVVLDLWVIGGLLVELGHRGDRECVEGGSVALVRETENVEEVKEGGEVRAYSGLKTENRRQYGS